MLVKFSLFTCLKNSCLGSTEDSQFSSEDVVLSTFFLRKTLYSWYLRHRGVRTRGISEKNITEGLLFEPPRSLCGEGHAEKSHQGLTCWTRGHRITARNNSLTAGRIFKSTEVLSGKLPARHHYFSSEAVVSDSVGQGSVTGLEFC